MQYISWAFMSITWGAALDFMKVTRRSPLIITPPLLKSVISHIFLNIDRYSYSIISQCEEISVSCISSDYENCLLPKISQLKIHLRFMRVEITLVDVLASAKLCWALFQEGSVNLLTLAWWWQVWCPGHMPSGMERSKLVSGSLQGWFESLKKVRNKGNMHYINV